MPSAFAWLSAPPFAFVFMVEVVRLGYARVTQAAARDRGLDQGRQGWGEIVIFLPQR